MNKKAILEGKMASVDKVKMRDMKQIKALQIMETMKGEASPS